MVDTTGGPRRLAPSDLASQPGHVGELAGRVLGVSDHRAFVGDAFTTVEVALDNVPRYTATCRQAVRATILPQLMMPLRSPILVDGANISKV